MNRKVFFSPLIICLIILFIIPAGSVFAADPIDVWKLVFSSVNTNNENARDDDGIRDFAYGKNTYVAIGSMDYKGKLYYSTDGQKWNEREYSDAKKLTGICFGNNKFVAVGNYQSAVSDDGIVWKFNDLSPTPKYRMKDIVYGNGYYVAVGTKTHNPNYLPPNNVPDYEIAAIMISKDGINWTPYDSTGYKDIIFKKVIYANNQFMVVGEKSPFVRIMPSNPEDRTKWQEIAVVDSGPYRSLQTIEYGNGLYMVIRNDTANTFVHTSKDGINWELVAGGNNFNIDTFYGQRLTFSNGVFVISGRKDKTESGSTEYGIFYSKDGKSWAEGASISGTVEPLNLTPMNNRIYGGGRYLSIFRSEPLIPPDNPINLKATAKEDYINVYWRKNPDVTGYRLYRAEATNLLLAKYYHIASTGADLGTYKDTAVEQGKTYIYKVQAFNNYGSSGFSDVASVTVPIEVTPIYQPGQFSIPSVRPTEPANLTASAVSSTEIQLDWEDKSDMELGYEIECRTDSSDYQLIDVVEANVTTYLDNELQSGTTYYYRVRAFTKDKESYYSNEAQAKTQFRIYFKPPQTIKFPEMPPKEEPPTVVVDPVPPKTEPAEGTVIKFYINKKNYIVNNENKGMDVDPIILEGRTLLPIRYVAEPLGAEVGWDGIDQKATISLDGKTVELWIGQNRARVNGSDQFIDANNLNVTPITVPPGRTMLPIRFIAESLGCGVDWDPVTREVMITK